MRLDEPEALKTTSSSILEGENSVSGAQSDASENGRQGKTCRNPKVGKKKEKNPVREKQGEKGPDNMNGQDLQDQVSAILRDVPEGMSNNFHDFGVEDIQATVDSKGSPVFFIKEPGLQYRCWNSMNGIKYLMKVFNIPKPDAEGFFINAQRGRLDYAGPVAGRKEGVYEWEGKKILALGEYKIPECKPGEFSVLDQTLHAILPDEEGRLRFQAWLYHAWKCLKNERWLPLPALVLIGGRGAGKTLLLELVRYVLGDLPIGHAMKYLSGPGSRINADLVGSIVLGIDDEMANNAKTRRVGLGQSIKKIAVTNSHRVEKKHVDPLTLDPHWRIVIASNDEAEDVEILPELNDSLQDKLLMLHCKKGRMPMASRTMEEREKFWEALVSGLPGFLHHMQSHPKVDTFGDERMQVTGWQDDYIKTVLLNVPKEERFLQLIDELPWWSDHEQRTLKGVELQSMLTGKEFPARHIARQILTWDDSAGSLLGRLAKTHPDRVYRAKPERDRKWVIKSPFAEGGEK